jgi:hypothetical protein
MHPTTSMSKTLDAPAFPTDYTDFTDTLSGATSFLPGTCGGVKAVLLASFNPSSQYLMLERVIV